MTIPIFWNTFSHVPPIGMILHIFVYVLKKQTILLNIHLSYLKASSTFPELKNNKIWMWNGIKCSFENTPNQSGFKSHLCSQLASQQQQISYKRLQGPVHWNSLLRGTTLTHQAKERQNSGFSCYIV